MSENKKTSAKKFEGFSDFEREAMKNRAKELLAEARASKKKEVGVKDVLDVIAAMPQKDKAMAKKIHEIITKIAPSLWPKTWYGMPAYAKNDKIVCFFQASQKFKTRYSTLGFNDTAKLDEGNMWPNSFAIKKLSTAEEKQIAALMKKALS